MTEKKNLPITVAPPQTDPAGKQTIAVVRGDGRVAIVHVHTDGQSFVWGYNLGGQWRQGPYTKADAIERAKAIVREMK